MGSIVRDVVCGTFTGARQQSAVISADLLPLTCSIFVHRIKGDPRMHFEVMPIFKEQSRSMIAALNGTGG